ncbi:MAG: hypothetical protein H6738_07870 [Alphaproteobacteria bacterium]|nr:hypothetical protein [Alphaproteobacteria bacterium]MCB9696683.1 hypothetical protein [Alphaproteobacteria bacterium]
MSDPAPIDALSAVTRLSRRVADSEDPTEIAGMLADAVAGSLGAVVVVVVEIREDGPALAAVWGVDPSELDLPDDIGSEMGQQILGRLGSDGPIRSYLLTAAGGLFGGLVVAWGVDGVPTDADAVAAALTDIAATGMDRAFRTAELRRTIDDLVRSREELARTAALRSLGQMSAVVAHEVKNPLTSIGGVLQVLRNRQPAGSQEHDLLGKLLDRLAELNRMLDELLSFSRPRPPVRQQVHCSALIGTALSLFRSDPSVTDVEVVTQIEDHSVRVDQGMIQRVLSNLLINASHAMEGVGRIDLGCAVEGGQIALTVRDQGPGVPEDQRERIFEPFFTTKVRGTGLGLPASRQIAEMHGGSLTVTSADGGGACFVLRLPAG